MGGMLGLIDARTVAKHQTTFSTEHDYYILGHAALEFYGGCGYEESALPYLTLP